MRGRPESLRPVTLVELLRELLNEFFPELLKSLREVTALREVTLPSLLLLLLMLITLLSTA